MENSDILEDSSDYNCIFEISINDIYLIALRFFKENKDKAFHMNYQNKIKMSAMSYYVRHGQFDGKSMPEIGLLDVVGKDIRQHWRSIRDATKEQIQQEFIDFLKLCCPEFTGFLEAKIKQSEIEAYNKLEEIKTTKERVRKEQEKIAQDKAFKEALVIENQKRISEENKLREILNQQTLPQFHAYAIQQHPDNVKAQEQLISQLQQHHFHQYMLAVYARNRSESGSNEQAISENSSTVDTRAFGTANYDIGDSCPVDGVEDNGDQDEHDSSPEQLNPVDMWCDASINDFKASFANERDSVMKIGSGEVVTIRVPASPSNEYLVWQFATDECDIGFGISWTRDSTGPTTSVTELVPVLRRDSHKQVHCGRLRLVGDSDAEPHFFLLRFDNSYSLWRHKWLYYRVCYSE